MKALTPAERRGALIVVALLALGTVHDLGRGCRPPRAAAPTVANAPSPGAPAPAPTAIGAPTPPARSLALDLNRADSTALDALPGIGPVMAGRILAYRREHGGFRSADELLAVKGVGPALLRRLGPLVTAGDSADSRSGLRAGPAGRRRPSHEPGS
jgi:competence protein ComEA